MGLGSHAKRRPTRKGKSDFFDPLIVQRFLKLGRYDLEPAKKKRRPKTPLFRCKWCTSIFDERLFSLVLDRWQQHDRQQQQTRSQQASRQWTRHKHAPVTT